MNYKINFKIKTPLCYQGMIMFDGILAYAYAQEVLGSTNAQTQKLSYSKDELIDFSPMPIVKNENGYFMASWMFYEKDGVVEYLSSWKKRWANEYDHLSDFGKNKRKVRINNSKFKSQNIPIRLIDIRECWFYFQSEDVSRVAYLIQKHIVGIGKKISQGNGLISSFEIENINHDPFKKVIRPIPVATKTRDSVYIGFYPPYWMSENQSFCIVK